MSSVVEQYKNVTDRVGAAADACGRSRSDVQLVAVSKTFDVEAIRPILLAGQRVFGENRVQEAASKWPFLRSEFEGVELHLIGPLQSNKVAEAVALFDVIETVDRPKIANAIVAEMKRQGKSPRVFIQVNTGDEIQKAGVRLDVASNFIESCKHVMIVSGLMCIPPANDSAPKHFKILADLASKHHLSSLSMGMSSDFEDAIQAGSTHVRVGSAIFGLR
jgi:PLP dependent protein